MNSFTKFLLINIGKIGGALLGLITACMIIFIGPFKTLFIFLFVLLGYLVGKWFDEGISIRKTIKDILASLRVDKWH